MSDTDKIDHPRMIFGAVGLAMGVATLVLSILNAVEPDTPKSTIPIPATTNRIRIMSLTKVAPSLFG